MSQQGYSYQVGPLCSRKQSGLGVYEHDTRGRKCKKRISLHDTGAGDELRANSKQKEFNDMIHAGA